MKNLDKAFEGKVLDDLKPAVDVSASLSNLIEPTEAEILEVVDKLKQGEGISEIWKTVRVGAEKKFCLSKQQISEIKERWGQEVARLTPAPEGIDLVYLPPMPEEIK